MPPGMDPDDYINKFGKENFYKLIDSKKDLTEFIFEYNVRTLKDFSPASLSDLEKKLMDLVNIIDDQIIKKYYRGFFKNKIFENLVKKNKNNLNKIQINNSFDKDRLNMPEIEVKEFSLCQLLIKFPAFSEKIVEKISEITFSSELANKIKNKFISLILNREDLSSNLFLDITKKEKIENFEVFSKFCSKNMLDNKINFERFQTLVDDYLSQLEKIEKLKKIEDLEKKFSTNMNEQAYNELISLKNSNNA